jgi:hypothetical protein
MPRKLGPTSGAMEADSEEAAGAEPRGRSDERFQGVMSLGNLG